MKIPITVAVTTFNRKALLKEAIESILEQTFKDFELLILDNHSTDGTADYVLNLSDERIRYVRNAPNLSPEFNGYSAVMIARGERIIVFHDDDIMERDMLQTAMDSFVEMPELAAVWCNHSTINSNGEATQENAHPRLESRIFEKFEYLDKFPKLDFWVYPSGLIFTKKYYPRYGNTYYTDADRPKVSPKLKGADPLTLVVMNLKGPILIISKPLFKYRRHFNQETNYTDISLAAYHLYQSLAQISERQRRGEAVIDEFRAIAARFRVQRSVLSWSNGGVSRRNLRLSTEEAKSYAELPLSVDSTYHAYLVRILMIQLSHVSDGAGAIQVRGDGAQLEHNFPYVAWYSKKIRGGGLFDDLPITTRVAILGTGLLGAMLVIDASQAGIRGLTLIDSNINRVGEFLLGLPILHTQSLAKFKGSFDLIVTSSERDQQESLVDMLRGLIGESAKICSWKDLALNVFPALQDVSSS